MVCEGFYVDDDSVYALSGDNILVKYEEVVMPDQYQSLRKNRKSQ